MEDCRPIEPLGLLGRFKQWLPFEIVIRIGVKDEKKKRQQAIITITAIVIALTFSLLTIFVHLSFWLIVCLNPLLVAYLTNRVESRKQIDEPIKGKKQC